MAVKQLSDGGPDGTKLGQSSTDLIGFWGATPIVQPSATNQGAVTSTAIVAPSNTASTSTTPFGFTTSTQFNALLGAVNSMVVSVNSLLISQNQSRTDLVALGLIKGSI